MMPITVPDTASQRVRESAQLVAAASGFVSEACGRDPTLLPSLIASGDLETPALPEPVARLSARAPAWPPGEEPDEAQVMSALRRWRTREMVRLAWRDLAGFATIAETLQEQSAFAECAIQQAHRHAHRILSARYGVPRSAAGVAQQLIVVGMGKLGGGELNFSSDIDLVFLFPEHGETDGARRLANEDFFTRLGQLLIRLLETRTPEGYLFRVDMRLRPFGDSGALVASFGAFEDYLQGHGRDWERYAWVKARAMTAAADYARIYDSAVRPFVYRRYLDFGVFESLREMKALIEREVERRDLAGNIKLGPGGIREIEFLAQSLQLIRGGREAGLRTPSLYQVLPLLDRSRQLAPGAAGELRAAYDFLRRIENRLQQRADEQTHTLPTSPDEQALLARAMGLADWPTLRAQLDAHRARVSRHFHAVVFGAAAQGAEVPVAVDLESAHESSAEADALAAALARSGWRADPAPAAQRLAHLREAAFVRRLDAAGRRRLQLLLPQMLTLIAQVPDPDATLERLLKIIEAIGKRSAYYALLNERGDARARLVEICGYGEFLVGQIAAQPLLLDELLDARLFEQLPGRAELSRELDLEVDSYQQEDPDRQVEVLRQFQQAAVFRVAVADLSGRLPLMQVSDRLTEIAELILQRVLDLSMRQIGERWGLPMCGEGAQRRAVAIAAVGYGKLGGRELGYGSDLDLVFLHDSAGERQETVTAAGAPGIDNQLFFVRLAQRILHLLTMHSSAGRLYEVDVRLRPSGKGGLLVTSLAAFGDYQQHEAWTWEHQALLHARAVAGDEPLRARFEALRIEVLRHHVRRETLRADVRRMRERMRRELSRSAPGQFDIKQDAGGVADIEFLAQYWALAWALRYPPLVMFSDTIRQLESLASADLVPQQRVDTLTHAYRAYRARTHRISLEGGANVVPLEEFVAERAAVTAIWKAAMLD